MHSTILLVEDDLDLAATVIDYLELESIACDHASNGAAGLKLLQQNSYQSLILDINLPRLNGLTLCESLRDQGIDIPVLMLTAKDQLADKLAGFAAGADDYLVKPFDLQELVARIKALSGRRSSQVKRLQVADLILDLQQKTVIRNNQPIKLAPKSMALLEILMKASPEPVSRAALLDQVWGEEQPDSNSLKVHMFKLRKAIDHKQPMRLIHTRAGHGFALYSEAEKNESNNEN